MTDDPHHTRRKRLKFRAWHRGMQEADLILGRFADKRLPTMSADELDQFEALLEQLDQDILDWLMGRAAVPADADSPIIQELLVFDFKDSVPQ